MFPKNVIFNLLLFAAVSLPSFSPAFAEILFQDNFDNSPDWQSNQTVNKSQSGGYDISFGQTRFDTCTTNCPPQGWTSYRAASSHWTDDRRKDTYVLSSEGARGGSGKGITYNVEVSGTYGTWAGGSLDLWLGETGYDELYIRYYLKFDPNWKWTDPADPQHGQLKLIRISTLNDNIWTTSGNPQQYGSTGLNMPVFYPDWYFNKSYSSTTIFNSERFAPVYTYGNNKNVPSAVWPSDGDWHCYEFYVKINSTPGVADGVWREYIDGVQIAESTTVEWKMAGSNTTHKWNWLMFMDNVTVASAALTDHVEMQMYMDDVVVSTEYIGTEDDAKTITLQPPTF